MGRAIRKREEIDDREPKALVNSCAGQRADGPAGAHRVEVATGIRWRCTSFALAKSIVGTAALVPTILFHSETSLARWRANNATTTQQRLDTTGLIDASSLCIWCTLTFPLSDQ